MRNNLSVLLCDHEQTDEIRYFVRNFTNELNIVYIDLATEPEYRKNVAEEFLPLYRHEGFVEYIGSNEATDHHKRLINNANVIAFGPGDPRLIFDELGTSELLHRIKDRINSKDRLLLIGQSAGSIYLCGYGNTHSYMDDDGKLVLLNRPCLDLIENTNVVPHARFYMNYLINGKTNSKKRVFGLTEGSAILFERDDIFKIDGNVFVYEDEQIKEWDNARNPEQN